MFIRRTFLILAILLAVFIASGVALISGSRLANTLNLFLPNGWAIHTPQGLNSSLHGITLPAFSVSYHHCRLFDAEQLAVHWWENPFIELKRATLDYACLAGLPNSNEPSSEPPALSALLAGLPEGELRIDELSWRNLPDSLPPRVLALLDQPSQSRFAFFQQKLTASLQQPLLSVAAELTQQQLQLSADYHPSENEQHRLEIESKLAENLMNLPRKGSLHYRWQLPPKVVAEPSLQQGVAELNWTHDNGRTSGQLQADFFPPYSYQLRLPFQIEQDKLSIEQAVINLPFPDFPLKAYLNARLIPNRLALDDLFPLNGSMRISLLSQSEKGKGNLVIQAPTMALTSDTLNLPLKIHGNVKFGNTILYSAVPLEIAGSWQDLRLKFLPTALLRLAGKARFLQITDLRFPLAGIRLDKSGINGRLHAILRGESPDFKQIELHLDGYANHFKAGLDTISQANHSEDRWNWRFWGSSRLPALNTPLTLAGRGHWHQNRVQLSEFHGKLDQIRQLGMTIPHIELALSRPIDFDYTRFQLDGAVKLSAPKIAFAYGGELVKPRADIAFNGETDNLNLKGSVTAGKLGPIKLFARRRLNAQSSELVGRLYWLEQPADVFQSLLPFRHQWVITEGTIKGETAFSANAERGLIAGGHFAIQRGAVSLPTGELKGIHFSLPYQFKRNRIELGVKQPIDVRIAELNLGLPMQDLQVKIDGNYPYHRQKPLHLRQLSVKLLGGHLNVERFALPQTQVAQLNLHGIRFEQILELAQYHQIQLKGSANATLPFWLSGDPCYICHGRLEQAGQSSLRFTDTLMKAIQQAGYTEQILAYTVNDSRLNELNADLTVDSNGKMVLGARVRTQLVEHEKTKINLNYTHTENLFDLWRSIHYGTQFEQQIEHQLYQQLDGE